MFKSQGWNALYFKNDETAGLCTSSIVSCLLRIVRCSADVRCPLIMQGSAGLAPAPSRACTNAELRVSSPEDDVRTL